MSSFSVSFLGGGILVVVMVKVQGFGQYRYTETWGDDDFYFLSFIDFSKDELRCVSSGNDTISIPLGLAGV